MWSDEIVDSFSSKSNVIKADNNRQKLNPDIYQQLLRTIVSSSVFRIVSMHNQLLMTY